jgi:hypothetical protein
MKRYLQILKEIVAPPHPLFWSLSGLAFGEEILSYQLLPKIRCCLQDRKALLEGNYCYEPLSLFWSV